MANGTEVGKAYVQIIPSAEGIGDSLKSQLGGASQEAGQESGSLFSGAFAAVLGGVGAAGFAAVGTVIAGAFDVITDAVSITTEAIAGCTEAFIDTLNATAEYGDAIDKQSQKLSISSQAYQEWDAVLQHSGTSMDAMGASFKKLANAAQDASDDQVAAFERIGLSMEEVSSMSTEELWSATIAGLQQMEEGTERTAIATDLLGRGAQELGALLNTSAEDTQAMIDKVNELGGVMSDAGVKASADYTDALQDMNTAFQGIINGTFANFLPSATEIVNGISALVGSGGIADITIGINDMANSIEDALPGMIDKASTLIQSFGSALTLNAPTILNMGADIVKQLGQGVISNIPVIVNTATSLVKDFAKFVQQQGPELINLGVDILNTTIDGFVTALPDLISAGQIIIETLDTVMIDNMDLLLDVGFTLFEGMFDGFINSMPWAIEHLPPLIDKLCQALVEYNTELMLVGTILFTSLLSDENLPEIIGSMLAVLPEIIDSMVETITSPENSQMMAHAFVVCFKAVIAVAPEIIEGLNKVLDIVIPAILLTMMNNEDRFAEVGEKLFTGLGNFSESIIGKLKDKAAEIINGMLSKIEEKITDFENIGINLVEGLWNGIEGKTSWLTDKLSGFCQSSLDVIKDFFDIHSPSKVMENMIGANLVAGIAVGVENNTSEVEQAMDELASVTVGSATHSFKSDMTVNTNTGANVETNLIYQLLAMYLPRIAESSGQTLEPGISRYFKEIQREAREYTLSTGLKAFP